MNPEATPRTSRFQGIDAIKIISALAVIWIHAAESDLGKNLTLLCRFAVPFFAATLGYFSVSSGLRATDSTTTVAYAVSRIKRFYIPFLTWSILYLLFRLAKHELSASGSPIHMGWSLFLTGTTHHLWFFPFALFVSIASFLVGRLLQSIPKNFVWIVNAVLVTAFALTIFFSTRVQVDLSDNPSSYFLFYSLDALPASILGVIFRIVPVKYSSIAFRSASFLVFFTSLCVLFCFGHSALVASISGTSLFFFSISMTSLELPEMVNRIADVGLGVYSIHLVFVEGLQFLSSSLNLSRDFFHDVMIFFQAAMLSIVSCLLFSRVRRLQFLFK